jgi:MFS family permease
VGAGTNLDIWAPIHRARAVSLFLVAPFLGPALGPAVGGYVAEYKGWRWTQWTTIFLGAVIWIYSLGTKETYAKIILAKRAKKLGKPLPPSPVPPGLPAIKFLLTVTIVRPIHMLLTEPIVGLYSLYTGFNFSVLFCFFAAFPLVFQGVYKFSVGAAGLVFLGISVGCIVAAAISLIIDRLVYIKRVLQNRAAGGDGHIAPENRLYAAMLGSVFLTVGLFWFAWTARADIHCISCVIATVFFACGNLLTFVSVPALPSLSVDSLSDIVRRPHVPCI